MTNLSTPISSIYSGWFYDAPNSRMNFYYRGTKVGHASATELQVDQALDVDGAANFAAEVECAANLHVQARRGQRGGAAPGGGVRRKAAGMFTGWPLVGVCLKRNRQRRGLREIFP